MHGHHHDSYKYYEPCLGIIYILLAAVTLASDKAILEDCMCSVHNITQQIGDCQLTNNLNYNNTGIDAIVRRKFSRHLQVVKSTQDLLPF
jgi:hypothetical protein